MDDDHDAQSPGETEGSPRVEDPVIPDDPTDTPHPTGDEEARENAENEPPA